MQEVLIWLWIGVGCLMFVAGLVTIYFIRPVPWKDVVRSLLILVVILPFWPIASPIAFYLLFRKPRESTNG